MKIRFVVGIAGCEREEVVEFDDELTYEEIEEYFKKWVWNAVYTSFEILDKDLP